MIKHQVEGSLSGPLGWEPHGEEVWSEDQGYFHLAVERITNPPGANDRWRWVLTDRVSGRAEFGYQATRRGALEDMKERITMMLGKAARTAAVPPPQAPGAAVPDPLVGGAAPSPTPAVPPPGAPPDRQSDKVVYVCPFCGSGNIIGNSDGSITCHHENVNFTVEVKPAHPSMPLVDENGQPFQPTFEEGREYPEIGMANAEGGPQEDPQAVDGSDPNKMPAGGGDSNKMPASDAERGEDEDVPEFLKSSMFITEDGVALSGPDYIRHLASRHLVD